MVVRETFGKLFTFAHNKILFCCAYEYIFDTEGLGNDICN